MTLSKERKYVLVTAAYNEEKYLGKLIESVVTQSVQPLRWIIVDDASTDGTAALVHDCARHYPFIQYHCIREKHARNFRAHVVAINIGYELLKEMDFEFVGNLDADIAFSADYFERLLEKFDQDPMLGIGGGFLYEDLGDGFKPRHANTITSVANGVQLFRRACYDGIGGYQALKYGAPDWFAEVSARMRGWWVESFPELEVQHLRPTGLAGGRLRNAYRGGLVAYTMGSHPLFELFKCARRIPGKPVIFGALARMCGLVTGYIRGEPRTASQELMTFLRREQMERLRSYFRSGNSLVQKPASRHQEVR